MLKKLFSRNAKTYEVTIEPFGTKLTVGARETILRAALKAGLAYPYECQTGACATCKTQLLEGDIKALTDFAYVLDLDDMRDGTILACQTLARSDLRLRVTTLDDGLPVLPPTRLEGRYAGATTLTQDIIEVEIELAQPLSWYAGQYANLSVPGVADSRSYSFSDPPAAHGSRRARFHVRVIPGGEMSGWFADSTHHGESIGVDGPYGVFRLREADVPIVCIAGGSGMAPIKAMLEHGAAQGIVRPVVFLYGARTQADLYPEALTRRLAEQWAGTLRFMPVLSEEPADSDWHGARGFVTDYIKAIDDFSLDGAQAYLCGPPPMIDAAVPLLSGAGIRGRDIYFDKFTDRSHLAGSG